MAPFNPTKPVQRRDGWKARIVCTDMKSVRPIVALIEDQDGGEWPVGYFEDGRVYQYHVGPHDLINVPEKHVEWLNIYPNYNGETHKTKELADAHAGGMRIACIRIEYEEGEGL